MSILVRDNKELIEFIKSADLKTLTKGKDENNIPYLKHIFNLHVSLFGETCTGCPSKIPSYINRIKNINLETMEKNNKKPLFILKKGVIIPVLGSSDVYSEHNITDEIAIELLKSNPNRKSLFQTVPDNLEELLEITEENEGELISIFGKEYSISEIKEFLLKINVVSNATSVKGVEKKINSLSEEQKNELEKLVTEV
ncbi:hypothetical protein [Tenacibaculum sp. 190524A02b]|uniref:hypothetical protein n=1 Tax=Tenacibaculum vairaonense TaxID=3137860 RepID=UPI0031FB0D71